MIERELAARLRTADRDERRRSYSVLYDELFRRVSDHPLLTRKADAESLRIGVAERLRLLGPYLRSDANYLEIGPGDCTLAIAVACRVKNVYAVDVSEEIAAGVHLPKNTILVISDGSSIPVLEGSIDVAYSDQLMEHLHPDDAAEQLRNIYRALAPGGVYICITPNRLSGPHDVSRHFDEVATGFHLKEYTVRELSEIFRATGFRRLRVLAGARGFHVSCPTILIEFVESLLANLPGRLGRILGRGLPLRGVLGIKLVAIKHR